MFKYLAKYKKKIFFYTKKNIFHLHYAPKQSNWFLVSPYGIGDTYIILSYLEEFKKANNVNKLTLGIVKKNHQSLIELFPDAADKIIFLENFEMRYCKKNIFSSGKIMVLHSENFLSNASQSIMGFKGFTLNDSYKLLLNININSRNKKPIISNNLRLRAKKRFDEYGLKENKTVIIAPNAVSISDNQISNNEWVVLSEKLSRNGYDIVFLSHQKEYQSIPFSKSVYFEISETIPFIELCGYFISIRSGICDVAATANCYKYILYPDIDWFSGSLYSCTSLGLMYEGVENLKEFIIDKDFPIKTLLQLEIELKNEK